MEDETNPRLWLIVGLIFAAAALRVLPHPPNFAPIGAIALFGGASFRRRVWAFAVPLAAMAVSDVALLALYGFGFDYGTPVIYATFALTVCIGFLLRKRRTAPLSVASAALASATLFYLTTNFAVWASSGLYPRTLSGLAACYVTAIPFFGPTVAGDLFYSAVLFGGLAWAERRVPAFAVRSA